MNIKLTDHFIKTESEQNEDEIKVEMTQKENGNFELPESQYDDTSADQNSTASGPHLSPENNMNGVFDEVNFLFFIVG